MNWNFGILFEVLFIYVQFQVDFWKAASSCGQKLIKKFVEIIFEACTGKLIGVRGFLPLVKAVRCEITLPCVKKSEYYLPQEMSSGIKTNSVFELTDLMPECKRYFEKRKIRFDRKLGIILLGDDKNIKREVVKINNNLFVGCDETGNLQVVYMKPERFI